MEPPQNLNQPMTQIPIFPIPVQSNESYLLYALCFYALEAEIYADMPNILPQLTAMKQGLEMAYTKLGVPLFEYRRFVVATVKDKESEENISEGGEDNVEMGKKEPEKE